MRSGIAKIPLQNSFCERCAEIIKRRIIEAQNLQEVLLFPEESLIVFNFKWANQVSEVLNILTRLGYPPVGDEVTTSTYNLPFCKCKNSTEKISLMAS